MRRKVHPVADLFPMMAEDELDDLAADIKANGLVHPIVIDAEGTVIDGRNRLAGCERAGVEPTFTTLNGQEPVAYILSANVARRHLSKGQQAMAVARARQIAGDLITSREGVQGADYDRSYLVRAKVVLDYAPDLADAVLAGVGRPPHSRGGVARRSTVSGGRRVAYRGALRRNRGKADGPRSHSDGAGRLREEGRMAEVELLTAEEVAAMRADVAHVHPRDRAIFDGTRWDKERVVATLEHLQAEVARLTAERDQQREQAQKVYGRYGEQVSRIARERDAFLKLVTDAGLPIPDSVWRKEP